MADYIDCDHVKRPQCSTNRSLMAVADPTRSPIQLLAVRTSDRLDRTQFRAAGRLAWPSPPNGAGNEPETVRRTTYPDHFDTAGDGTSQPLKPSVA